MKSFMSENEIRQKVAEEGQRGSRKGQEGRPTPPYRASWSTDLSWGVRGDGICAVHVCGCTAVCLSVSDMHTTTATRLLPLLPSPLYDKIVFKSEFTVLSFSDKYTQVRTCYMNEFVHKCLFNKCSTIFHHYFFIQHINVLSNSRFESW